VIFEVIVFKEVRLGGAIIAGMVLALIPYLLLRGPVNRLMRRKKE